VGIKVNENYRKRYNKVLMQLLGDLDMPPFGGTVGLNWIGRVHRMVSTRNVIQMSNDKPHERRLRGRPKNRW